MQTLLNCDDHDHLYEQLTVGMTPFMHLRSALPVIEIISAVSSYLAN